MYDNFCYTPFIFIPLGLRSGLAVGAARMPQWTVGGGGGAGPSLVTLGLSIANQEHRPNEMH